MRHFISDTHFGHARIIELCNRPFADVPTMNEALVANWNAVVAPEDEVFHLGDVALGPWVEWDAILTRLNGFKTLVVGNHDRVFKGMSAKEQAKFTDRYNGWFDVVVDEVTGFRLSDGTKVNMSHFPYDGDSHGEDRHGEFRLADEGVPLIHGHTHLASRTSLSQSGTPQVHVGVDAHFYRPVSEARVIELFKEGMP